MANGAIDVPPAGPEARAQRIVPVQPTAMPPAPPSRVERRAGLADIWHHVTLDSTSAVWPAGVAVVQFPGPITRVEIFADQELVIAFSPQVANVVGRYDLFHPGGGQLDMSIPETNVLAIATQSGAAPTDRVEVYGFSGAYALR